MPRVLSAVLLCAALVLPADAVASSVKIEIAPDPSAGKPLALTVSGVADRDAMLRTHLEHATKGCLSWSSLPEVSHRVSGPFTFAESLDIDEAGDYVLCAALRAWDDDAQLATALVPFTARPPRVVLHINAPKTLPRGASFRVRVSGWTELEHWVSGELVPSDGECDPDQGIHYQRLGLWTVNGPFSVGSDFVADRYGTWRMCAYLRWRSLETAHIASVPVRVTIPCTRASRALSRARDRWRGLNRRLRFAERPANRALRRRGAAVRRARRAVARACPR